MNIFKRWARKKSAAQAEEMTLNQLLDFLGVARGTEESMSEATYYACIKVLSESIGKLPLRLMQRTPNSGVQPVLKHQYYRMLNQRPNPYMSSSVFWTYMEQCRNHYGNAYALIDSRDVRHPKLWPLDPTKMRVVYDDKLALSDAPAVWYAYSTSAGVQVYHSEEILHFKSHLTQDGLVGISVREQLASTIQGNIKAQKMVEKMYESGMTAKAVLQYTGGLDDKKVEALRAGIASYAAGELGNSKTGNIIPLPVGTTLQPLNLKLADSQFLETKQYSALQIAAAFGVKPSQIGDYTKSSYSSAEAQQLSFLVDTLLFNIKQYEEEISWKLLTDAESACGISAKFDTAVLLRADMKTKIETLAQAVNSFLYTPNEAREELDKPHKAGGDELLGNGAAIPVQYAGQQYTKNDGKEEKKEWEKMLRDIVTEVLSTATPA